MEIGNLGDKCHIRLDHLNSHGRSIINKIMCNDTSEKKACAHGKIIFHRNSKGHWRCQSLGICFIQHLPVKIFARGVTQGSGKMITESQVIPRSYWNLEGPLDVPKVGDMNCSTPANEDPCQEEMSKARHPGISKKDMEVKVSLLMQI